MMFRKISKTDYLSYYTLINQFRETVFNQAEFNTYIDTLPSNIEIWVIEENFTIIATATIIIEPKLIFNLCKFAHLEDVCVLESHRQNNIGSYLLKCIQEQCRLHKCRKITLACNETIQKFYIKNGFEVRGVQCSLLL
jgi:predicted GNAT family N-acyltransferase